MKKILKASAAMLLLGLTGWAQDGAAGDGYGVSVSGDAVLVLKRQESYISPLDMPSAGIGDRAGASDREIQWFRAKANVNVSSGTPGESEWFGAITLSGDFNSPDNMDKMNGNVNEELKKVEISNAFAMWRPEMLGGRPLGIAFGVYGIKPTANAAYSNIFSGDPDSDFPAYSINALTGKPMVNADFHISPSTGIGFAVVKGGSDIVKIAAQYDEDTMITGVAYAEAGFKGLSFNAGYQFARGNKTEIRTTASSSPSEGAWDYVAFNPKYFASAVNAQLAYTVKAGNISVKPFVGYNCEFGQEALDAAAAGMPTAGTYPADARNTLIQVITGGAQLAYKVAGMPVRLSGEYSAVLNADFNMFDMALRSGSLDSADSLAAYNAGLAATEAAYSLPAGTLGTVERGVFSKMALDDSNTNVSAFSGLEGQYNLELAADVSPKVTAAIFLNGQLTKKVAVRKVTDAEKAKLAAALKDAGIASALGAGQDAVCAGVADGIAAQIDSQGAGTAAALDWSDSFAYGFSLTYRF